MEFTSNKRTNTDRTRTKTFLRVGRELIKYAKYY